MTGRAIYAAGCRPFPFLNHRTAAEVDSSRKLADDKLDDLAQSDRPVPPFHSKGSDR